MYRIIRGTTHKLPDTPAFIETLNQLEESPVAEARRLFDPKREIVVARAPGRLDVMGGIADYSGSLVLELPLQEATYAALQRDPSRRLRIVSLAEDSALALAFEMPLADFEGAGDPVDYEAARARFERDPARHWAAYVAGVFLVLMREREFNFQDGARILIASRVPQGKGVSSSAALEVAVMQAVAAAFEITIEAREMALLCQKAENLVAGAPCGVMDQGFNVHGTGPGEPVHIDDPRWGGYLANLTPSELEQVYAAQLPERLRGADFLSRYQGTTDPVTRVDPDRSYTVRVPTAHAIYEHHRVRLYAELIGAAANGGALELLGELMYQSHASYSACGLGSASTDRLVRLVREAGPAQGLYGAKITGGGSGGTVAVLGRRDAGTSVERVAERYARETGCQPYIFAGSSPGSAAFGHLKLEKQRGKGT